MDNSAAHIIAKCGGPLAVADMLGIDLASVYKWRYPRSRGGADGRVPTGRQAELLRLARAAGIDLKPEDFFAGLSDTGLSSAPASRPSLSGRAEAASAPENQSVQPVHEGRVAGVLA